MGYQIIRGPFMLQETVGMMCLYVSGYSYRNMLNQKKHLTGMTPGEVAAVARRRECLQRIMEEVCADLDTQDPTVQRFFGRIPLDCEWICMAQHLTCSFVTLREPDFRRNAQEICEIWHNLQSRGAWIHPQGVGGLLLTDKPGSPGDLFDQVAGTVFPAEYQMKLYAALRNFDQTMAELVELMEPYAIRLKQALDRESWLYDDVESYWRRIFQKTTPEEFLIATGGQGFVLGAGEETRIAINMMYCKHLIYEMMHDSLLDLAYNVLFLGSAATANSMVSSHGGGTSDDIGLILKALGEKKRLDILRYLSQNRSYCHELADKMDINPGNMSRHLATLYHYGFIRQEREPSRHYYETDREAIHNFFQLVEAIIAGEE